MEQTKLNYQVSILSFSMHFSLERAKYCATLSSLHFDLKRWLSTDLFGEPMSAVEMSSKISNYIRWHQQERAPTLEGCENHDNIVIFPRQVPDATMLDMAAGLFQAANYSCFTYEDKDPDIILLPDLDWLKNHMLTSGL